MEIINITDEIIEVNVTEAVVNVVTQNGAYPLPSNVFSVFGRVGNVVGQIGDYTTSIVEEGTNLYYTQARFDTAFGNKTTTDLDEGTNLYYTDARSRAAISENITGIDYSSASGIFSLASGYVIPTQSMLDAKVPYTGATGDVNLNSHKLLTAQVKATSSAGLSINSNGGTQIANFGAGSGANMTLYGGLNGTSASFSSSVIGNTIVKSGGTSVEFLKADGSVDSTTYTSQARTISTTAPLTGGGDLSANRTFAINQSGASADGYLSSTDWNTFNGKENFLASGTTAQYYRGDKTFQTLNTLAVPENTNLYYTQARFDTAFGNKSTTNLVEGTNLYYTAARFNTAFTGKTTNDLAEGTNLYYTDARARAAITGTAPINVSGGVVSISQASGSSNGYLSSTDWNTFNSKQAALNGTGFVKISGTTISYDTNTYLTTISGIAAGGELSGTYPNPTLVNSAVTGKVLTGLNLTGGGTIADTDSILGAFGKVQNQISALVGGVMYEGTWDASTNTPTIVSSVGSKGDYYIVSVAGTTNINGITSWNIGDWIIFNGTTWDKVDNTDAVSSVNGYTGAVSLVTSDVPESGNLYFTNDRAIGSTLTGYTSGAGTISSSDTILQAIQKLNGNVSGLVTGVSSVFGRTGAVTAQSGDYTTTQVTEGTNLYYTEGRVSANTDVAANTAARHAAVTLGTANGLSLVGQALSLGLSSGSATGALSSTDWNTFNNKQAALNGTGFVKISGTTISYDNSTYLTTSSAASTYLPLSGGTLTGALSGTSATFSGAVGIGGAPSTFDTIGPVLQINRGVMYSYADGVGLAANFRYESGDIYINSNYSTLYQQSTGEHRWFTAPSGTAGSAITFTQRMTLTNGGNVGIGTSSFSGWPSTDLVLKTQQASGVSVIQAVSGDGGSGVWMYSGSNSSDNPSMIFKNSLRFGTATDLGTGGYTERFRITSGGNVCINTTTTIGQLNVEGLGGINLSAAGRGSRQIYFGSDGALIFYNTSNYGYLSAAGAWINASDISIKKDIIDIKYSLDDILKLKPRSYKMKDGNKEEIGFVAQEVEEIIPEVVNDAIGNGVKGLNYGNMVALLVKAIQELSTELNELKALIAAK